MARRATSSPAPARLYIEALATLLARQFDLGGGGGGRRHPMRVDRVRGPNLVATARDYRPSNPERGRAILAGRFQLGGASLDVGPGGDPFDQPSPSRRFAVHLHRFDWLLDLLACGEAGARDALRLYLDWRRLFYRANRFVWSAEVLERRVFNLACGVKRMAAVASDVEAAILFNSLLHQAQRLSQRRAGPVRAAERLGVAATAAATLSGRGSDAVVAACLPRLAKRLPDVVLADGGLKSRSPEAVQELLFDLTTLDDVLLQRGRETPVAVTRAIDRLTAGLRFFTLGDGRLASFQGGGPSDPERVRAALAQEEDAGSPLSHAPHTGYHRLGGPTLRVIADAGPPAEGRWSVAACAQPLAIEITAGEDRLIANDGWSPDAAAPQAFRLTAAGSTLQLAGDSAGRPLGGFLARQLGPRLMGGAATVKARREENPQGVWLDLYHGGWARRYGVAHARRLFVDAAADELRGEDILGPAETGRKARRALPYAIRFHVPPEVQVSVARDGKSVLLRGPSERGWWFRNDAATVTLEPSVWFDAGLPQRTFQVVLGGELAPGGTARVRWKLSPIEAPRRSARRSARGHGMQEPALAGAAPSPEAPAAPAEPILAEAEPPIPAEPGAGSPAAAEAESAPLLETAAPESTAAPGPDPSGGMDPTG